MASSGRTTCAWMLSKAGEAVEIGADLDPQLASEYKLPRLVNG